MFTYACTTNLSPACVLGAEVPKHEADCQAVLKFRIWLLAVDRLVSESSVEIMKLGFLGDKNEEPYKDLEKAKQPSDIFHVLEDNLGSKEAAEQRFIYAINRLGDRRYGSQCIKAYRQIVGKRLPPKFETRNKSADFGLCQCLVDICVKAKEDVSKALIQYCSNYLLKTNPENIRSLAYMFTKMYHRKVVTPDNQEKLATVLTILEANKCIKCIQNYRSKYTLPKRVIDPEEVKRVQRKHKFDYVCFM